MLGFDTSANYCSAALLRNGRKIAGLHEEIKRGQAERLFPLLGDLLYVGQVEWTDLKSIGVGIGPGNFTGIRLAVSAARGLSMSLGIPAIGINRFDALSLGVSEIFLVAFPSVAGQYFCRLGRDGEPFTSNPESLAAKRGENCIIAGDNGGEIAERQGLTACRPKFKPGEAVARLAAQASGAVQFRPVPMYLRSPSAVAVK